MTFSFLILCVCLILVLFNVGESSTKRLISNKWVLVAFLIAEIVTVFFAPITIWGISVSIAGFILPAILCVFMLFKVNSLFSLLRIGISMLLVITFTLIYNAIDLASYDYMLVQPYVFLALGLGISVYLINKTLPNTFTALFLGLTISFVIHFLTKNSYYGYLNIELGGEQALTVLLTGVVASLISNYFVRKMRVMKKRRAKKRELNAEAQNN